ncbi:MAG: SDR family NAD(P)-dependent oxidoreductase, partial [Candidatus Hodarchaeales archaeon]
MKTTEKVALVTGATKGIGKAICNKLIELDMNLIITAR